MQDLFRDTPLDNIWRAQIRTLKISFQAMKKAFQLETAKNLNHDCKLNGFRRFSYPKEAGLALGGPGFSPFVMLEVSF